MSDYDFSPRPAPGKWIWFTYREGVHVDADPFYGDYRLDQLQHVYVDIGKWWFFSVDLKLFHFYIGYKPISLDDPKFYWRAHSRVKPYRNQGKLFVQWSARIGRGEWR